MTARPLRPHQTLALDLLKASIRSGKKRPVLQAPTGFGKTRVGAEIVSGARRKGNRVTFCVPALSLINQTFEAFVQDGVDPSDMGIIQADHPWTRPHAPIQIASVQTLARRKFPITDIIVVDEAHIQHDIIKKWMADPAMAGKLFVALSATPWARGMALQWDDLLKPTSTRELIDQGYLSPFRVFAPSHPDLSKVKTIAGDYQEDQLADAMGQPSITADIVSTWLEKGPGEKTLCFCVNRAHAQKVHDAFEAAKVRVAYIDANTEREERESIGKALLRGDVQVVCNIGCLTTGIDWDVRCIILARPTKSEMLYVQIIGRGLRTADGKDHCIARDSLVLTDKGEVKIQDVTLDHKVWDGVNYVAHAGAVCKGVQPVISHDGVTATPEHLVMTNEGWKTIEGAHRLGLRIARTGMDSSPIRFFDDCLGQGGRIDLQPAGRSRVRKVQASAHGAVSQHAQAPRHGGVSALQWSQAGHCPEMAVSALPIAAGPLPKSVVHILRSVWRAWDRISVFVSERRGRLGSGKPWHSGQVDGVGSQGQRRPLRAGEPSLGSPCPEHEQYHTFGRDEQREIYRFSESSPGNSICRQNARPPHKADDGRSNHSAVEHPILQAEREVWDIHNAGPLQRFTANGRLVHNCLVLDHSDTTLRLGMVDEIDHDELDDGTKKKSSGSDKEERDEIGLPKACDACGCLVPPKTRECPACGHVRRPKCNVVERDGALAELERGGKRGRPMDVTARLGAMPRKELWAEIRGMQELFGWSDGRTAHCYRDITGAWPKFPKYATALEPSNLLRGWVRAKSIAYAKAKAAKEGVAAE